MQVENPIYTIGHSNQPLAALLGLLRQHAIELVVDTRSAPYSRYSPQFNREHLQRAIERAGMQYQYRGRELGGRPGRRDFYNHAGYVLYGRVAATPEFRAALLAVAGQARDRRIVLMCSEEDPAVCHRHRLIAKVFLKDYALDLQHIRGDGGLLPASAIPDAPGAKGALTGQLGLFDQPDEDTWTSIRSVLPRDQLGTSSAR